MRLGLIFMPPEPYPWDRKDFFKERKHERSESLGSASRWVDSSSHHRSREFASRWRDSSSHHRSREFERWGPRDFRRAPGHGKQGGWYSSGEELGDSYLPSRPVDKILEDDRPSISRGDGKYKRSSRENRVSFTSREGKSQYGEPNNGRLNTHARLPDVNKTDQISGNDLSHSDSHYPCDQLHPKEQDDEQTGLGNGLGTGHKMVRENSLDWKPLKWTRSGSLSSRGSGFSHTSSSKSLGNVDSNHGKSELQLNNSATVQSTSGDGAACVTSPPPSEETLSRKKPRLGWGEGLAKYEKKKVEVPDDGPVVSASNIDSNHFFSPNLADKSPTVVGFNDCTSPATPSSVACSSSPGVEDKFSAKPVKSSNGTSNLCASPYLEAQNFLERLSLNLEKLDFNSIANLGASVADLLQTDNPFSQSSFVRLAAINKLLSYKGDILKVLETTESEIDLLENELKVLKTEPVIGCPRPATSSSVPRPPPLKVDRSAGEAEDCKREEDSPGTATSKFVESDVKCSELSLKLEQCPELVVASNENGNGSAVVSNGVHLRADEEQELHKAIYAENKRFANNASEVLNKLLPNGKCDVTGGVDKVYLFHGTVSEERFARRQRNLRFKDRALTLKFKALKRLWKEDTRLLSLKKQHPKSHKKGELSLRTTTHNGYQKPRSSIRSRFNSLAGNVGLCPTSEIVEYTSKLLLDSKLEVCRDEMKMPIMFLEKDRFVSTNGLVKDPVAVEKERSMINPWTAEEREIFIDKLSIYGKDFTKISSFLDHKVTADCVQFYYKNHKSDCSGTQKKLALGKQKKPLSSSKYLVASAKKWNRDVNAASLEILGTASVMAANADNIYGNNVLRRKSSDSKPFMVDNGLVERPDELESVAADVLAGLCGSVDFEEEVYQEMKYRKTDSVQIFPSKSDVTTQNGDDDDETCSDESSGEIDHSDWTDREKSMFMQAVSLHGKDFEMIARFVRTKSEGQCKVFFSKARKCLRLDLIRPEHPADAGTLVNDDANRGQDDEEDACIVKLESQMDDEDLPSTVVKAEQDESNSLDIETKPSTSLMNNKLIESNCCQVAGAGEDKFIKQNIAAADSIAVHPDESIANTGVKKEDDKVSSGNNQLEHASLKFDTPNVRFIEAEHVSIPDSVPSVLQRGKLPSQNALSSSSSSKLAFRGIKGSDVKSPQILSGYPLQISRKEMKGDISCRADINLSGGYLANDCYLQKCNGLNPPCTMTELPLLAHNNEQTSSRPRGHSRSLSDMEKPHRNGDGFKLFGKILSKTDSETHEKDHQSKQGSSKLSNLKFSNGPIADKNTSVLKFDRVGYPGLENVPRTSYGFWEGNPIVTGLPALQESAFFNFQSQQSFQAVNANGVPVSSVFSPSEMCLTNGISFGGCDATRLQQPFTVDGLRKQHEAFTVMQNLRSCEAAQQGSGILGMNVLGRGGILVGAPCTSISDPVAAIEMHYTKNVQYLGSRSSGDGSIIREEEWRCNDDIGR